MGEQRSITLSSSSAIVQFPDVLPLMLQQRLGHQKRKHQGRKKDSLLYTSILGANLTGDRLELSFTTTADVAGGNKKENLWPSAVWFPDTMRQWLVQTHTFNTSLWGFCPRAPAKARPSQTAGCHFFTSIRELDDWVGRRES